MEKPVIFTVGHSNKPIEKLIEELHHFDIKYVIDVRSQPYSKYNPQYNKENLKASLSEKGIVYAWWGKQLGGRPEDPSVYTDGKVDYEKLKVKPYFREGIERLIKAHRKGIRVALLCSEREPARCHRSKLIGQALKEKNIPVVHIVRHKTGRKIYTLIQKEVMQRVDPFGENLLFKNLTK